MKQRGSGTSAAGSRRGRLAGPLLATGVLITGIVVTLLTVSGLRTVQRQNADRVMDQRTAVARAVVASETGRYQNLLQSTAAGVSTKPGFTGLDFAALTLPMLSAELLGATSVGFLAAVPRDGIAAAQRDWRARGSTGLVLDPRGNPDEHFFSIFSRSLQGQPAIRGVDVTASAEASAALIEARRTGRPTVSDTYVLLRDRGLPAGRQQLSFIFAAPVYTPEALPRFLGWMVLGVRGQDFLGSVLGVASQGQLDAELIATNIDGRRVQVAAHSARGPGDLRRQATVPVANRQWTLVTAADSAFLPGARSSLPLTVLLGGLALTVLLAWLIHNLATGRSRARARLRVATAELRTADEDSRRQAGLLGAIMDSLGDGVGVVDEHGEFLLHNPAAKRLLGITDDVGGAENWQEHYGLFRPDGRSPFPVDEMPLVRALRGESCDGVEMLIRNVARPDGILVSVDGRPLDVSAEKVGAVAVFHDITDLRRYEADLAVFAGVVAHDLKAPLAVIRLHCESATEELAEVVPSVPVHEALSALGRIADAVDRMAGMIDTLLAYTTSRDAPLSRRTVDLAALVEDVIAGRTGPLRGGAGPAVYVGPLPEVDADPAMLRHVVDNLLGNALKYVPAGRPARIDVTAEATDTGWIRVEVADRGIGIPDADKPNIFESFHRSQSASAYAGTGLGLAICRRVVERHGGVIGVADNPGGGTRIYFTIPAASAAASPPDEPAEPGEPAEPVAPVDWALPLLLNASPIPGPHHV